MGNSSVDVAIDMAKIELKNVIKSFGNVIAINNISIEIYDREFLVMLGPSGCGKTTIAKKIENNISKKYGPTIILSGDDLKKIFNYNKFKSAFNLTDSFLINSILGAVRLFFSISFKYDGATPI